MKEIQENTQFLIFWENLECFVSILPQFKFMLGIQESAIDALNFSGTIYW